MASGPGSCAPCVFGAVSTNILTYPTPIATLSFSVIPHVTVINGSSSTSYQTSTFTEPGTITGVSPGTAAGTTIDITDTNDLTWSTLGTVLTYPTTYVQYVAFQGAAVTASSACAESLAPSAVSLPASTDPASLVYPVGGTALPLGLLNYLDGIGVPSQLDGDQLTTCGPIGPAPPTSAPSSPSPSPSPTVSNTTSTVTTTSSTSTLTSVTTTKVTSTSISSTTIVTTTKNTSPTTLTSIPPLTTITTTQPSIISTSQVVATTNTVTHTTARIVQTVTGPPIIYQSGTSSTEAPSALAQSKSSSSASSSPSGPALSNLLSIIESLATATVTLTSTSTLGTGGVFPSNSSSIASSTTPSVIPATGAAQRVFKPGWFEWALGLALPLLV